MGRDGAGWGGEGVFFVAETGQSVEDSGVRIRYRENRPKKPWELDCGMVEVEGKRKRVQLYFERKREAEAEFDRRAKLREKHGAAAFSVSEDERVRFAALRDRAKAMGVSLESVVDFYEAHHFAVKERVLLGVLVERGMEAKGKIPGMDDEYYGQLTRTWEKFAVGREGKPVELITSGDVGAWLNGYDWKGKTKRNYLSDLSQLFKWGMRPEVRLCSMNPCEGVEVEVDRSVGDDEITCLTPEMASDLLEGVRWLEPALLWYPVVGLFCGIRSKERQKLRFCDVHLEEGVVVIGKRIAKGRRSRGVVTLPAVAVSWLKLWESTGAKEFRFSRDAWARARWKLGWDIRYAVRRQPPEVREDGKVRRVWDRNVERHTFASMHYAMHRNEALLKKEMRHHTSEETLFQHYRAVRALDGRLITKAVAGEFWGAFPAARMSDKLAALVEGA